MLYRIEGPGAHAPSRHVVTTHTATAALSLRLGVQRLCGSVEVYDLLGTPLNATELLRLAERELA
jgi:hypothetical protein